MICRGGGAVRQQSESEGNGGARQTVAGELEQVRDGSLGGRHRATTRNRANDTGRGASGPRAMRSCERWWLGECR